MLEQQPALRIHERRVFGGDLEEIRVEGVLPLDRRMNGNEGRILGERVGHASLA